MESVETMARIAVTAEEAALPPRPPRSAGGVDDVQAAMSAAVSELAVDLDLAAIVPLTQSGATALAVSRFRPSEPIVAVTPFVSVARRLSLAWGVTALVMPFADETGELLDGVARQIREHGVASAGERIAMTAGLGTCAPGGTDFVHVRTV